MKTFILIFLCSTSLAQPLATQEVYIRWSVYRYRVDEGFLRAVLRYESGCKGYEAGFNKIRDPLSPMSDPQSYSDPTMPDGAIQQCRLSRRILLEVQNFVFMDPQRRNDFLVWWAAHYHCNGDVATDTYSKELKQVFKEEREYLKHRDASAEYQPFSIEKP